MWGQVAGLLGFGDFEPAAVAGVAGLADQGPQAAWRVASQLLVGWVCWLAICRDSKASRGRMELEE